MSFWGRDTRVPADDLDRADYVGMLTPLPVDIVIDKGTRYPDIGYFVYYCTGCHSHRTTRAEWCPNCGSPWAVLRMQEIMAKERKRLTGALPILCSWREDGDHFCTRALPRGTRGPYCDWHSGC